jgi:hypothetical protein
VNDGSGVAVGSSPTDRNDLLELELPRAWEPLDSLRPLSDGEGQET